MNDESRFLVYSFYWMVNKLLVGAAWLSIHKVNNFEKEQVWIRWPRSDAPIMRRPGQDCEGSATIRGSCSQSGPCSATECAQRMRSADYMKRLNDSVRPSTYVIMMARAYSKMAPPGLVRLTLWKDWLFSHMNWPSPSDYWQSFGCAGRGFVQWSDSTVVAARSW